MGMGNLVTKPNKNKICMLCGTLLTTKYIHIPSINIFLCSKCSNVVEDANEERHGDSVI